MPSMLVVVATTVGQSGSFIAILSTSARSARIVRAGEGDPDQPGCSRSRLPTLAICSWRSALIWQQPVEEDRQISRPAGGGHRGRVGLALGGGPGGRRLSSTVAFVLDQVDLRRGLHVGMLEDGLHIAQRDVLVGGHPQRRYAVDRASSSSSRRWRWPRRHRAQRLVRHRHPCQRALALTAAHRHHCGSPGPILPDFGQVEPQPIPSPARSPAATAAPGTPADYPDQLVAPVDVGPSNPQDLAEQRMLLTTRQQRPVSMTCQGVEELRPRPHRSMHDVLGHRISLLVALHSGGTALSVRPGRGERRLRRWTSSRSGRAGARRPARGAWGAPRPHRVR